MINAFLAFRSRDYADHMGDSSSLSYGNLLMLLCGSFFSMINLFLFDNPYDLYIVQELGIVITTLAAIIGFFGHIFLFSKIAFHNYFT